MRILTFVAVALAALTMPGAVQHIWQTETSEIAEEAITAYHGETIELQCKMTSYGKTLPPCRTDALFLWQTNGMGNAWWQTNAVYSSGAVKANWTPYMDTGSNDYRFFLIVSDTKGGNYRANGTIQLLGSPYGDTRYLPLPLKVIDFASVKVENPGSSPFAVKGAEFVTPETVTNIAKRIVDTSFVGGTNAVNSAITNAYTKAEVDGKLAGKADKSEADELRQAVQEAAQAASAATQESYAAMQAANAAQETADSKATREELDEVSQRANDAKDSADAAQWAAYEAQNTADAANATAMSAESEVQGAISIAEQAQATADSKIDSEEASAIAVSEVEQGIDHYDSTVVYPALEMKADKTMISADDETFSTAVLAVGLNIDTNSVAVLNEIAATFGGFPIAGTATTVGGLLAALAAAVAWLRKRAAHLDDSGLADDDFATGLLSKQVAIQKIDERLPIPISSKSAGFTTESYKRFIVTVSGDMTVTLHTPTSVDAEIFECRFNGSSLSADASIAFAGATATTMDSNCGTVTAGKVALMSAFWNGTTWDVNWKVEG